jgi:arsenate reductase (thioredoxin)
MIRYPDNATMSSTTQSPRELQKVQESITRLVAQFNQIAEERKVILDELTNFITHRSSTNKKTLLNFICTHNSRRSHIAQIWAQTAAYHFGVGNVETFSGGTEATAFNLRAVEAMKRVGFEITTIQEGSNPVYAVKFSSDSPAMKVFSKKYDDPSNPRSDFAAIMTCSHADENCPFVAGATKRIALTYNDPKDFDGTPQEEEMYSERVDDIGREILYAFSMVR